MTTPVTAIKREISELIQAQVETFARPNSLTITEIAEFRSRAQRIKNLGQLYDRVITVTIREQRFGKAS